MYLQVKASSLDLQMPTRGRVAPRWGPAPQLDKIPVQHLKILTYFYHRRFLFHVSFFTFNKVIINDFKRWNIKIICFTFSFIVSLFHFYRFAKELEITTMKKNTMRAIYRSHCVLKSLPQCSWIAPIVFFRRMKHESKNETYTIYVSSLEHTDY